MKSDLDEMIYKLAERGLNRSLAGEGSQESRAVALILSAVDQLATAAAMDEVMSPSIQQAIDVLRQQIETRGGKQKKSDQLFGENDGGGDEKKEMDEKKTPDGTPSKDGKEVADGR